MSERKRFFLLIFIMAAASVIIAGATIAMLYQTALNEEKARLVETAQSQARLIEAIARFDSVYSKDYPKGSTAATLSQIIDAHEHYKGFGESGEFTLSQKAGDAIDFLLSHRHYDLDKPKPILFNSELAEPMRLALSGKSGTVVGLDYRGETVLAAHEPIKELDLGIVAKIDMWEIRAPFVKTGLAVGLLTLIIVLIGTGMFIRVSNPIIKQLENRAVELEGHVEERTNELLKANEQLERIFDTTHFCLVLLDRAFNFIRVNQAYADACRYNPEFFTGKNHFNLYPHEENEAIFRNVVETGEPYIVYAKPFEFPDMPERGITYWDWTLNPLKDASGNVEGLVFALVEVTEQKMVEEAHRKSEANLAEAQRIGHLGNWDWNTKNKELSWSDEIYRIFGLTPQEFGASYEAFLNAVHPEDRDLVDKAVNDALYEKKPYNIDHRIILPDGSEKIVHELAEVHFDETGKAIRMQGTVQDISERKQKEEALRSSEKRYRTIFEQLPDAVVIIDPKTTTPIEFNRLAPSLLGYSEEEFAQLKISDYEAIETPEEIKGHINTVLKKGKDQFETQFQTKNGKTKDVMISIRVIDLDGQTVFHNIFRDITEQKRAREALSESESNLRALTIRLAGIEEIERRRLTQELHDRVGQNLTALDLNLSIILNQLSDESTERVTTRLTDSMILVNTASEQIRNVMAELRPRILDDYGLMAALRWYTEIFLERTGIFTELREEEPIRRLSPDMETAFFRIAQEALTNVAKHSRANQVILKLKEINSLVRLTIEDDGVGFDPDGYKRENTGWGIDIMKERAQAQDGYILIQSEPGKGTVILVEMKR